MPDRTLLLTSPIFPYPTLPNNTALTDPTGARFTHADGVFGLMSHTHCFANHILAQNVDVPSVILEYPRWEDFKAEADKGYRYVGISALPVHLDSVLRMCEHLRERSPETQILLGCYAGMALKERFSEEEQKRYVDHICHGEGVRFIRELFGEDPDRPVNQVLMPKAGGAPTFITRFPTGTVAFLVSGLGCPGRCDFCSSTALFDHRRIEMLPPEDLIEHMYLYHQHFPTVTHVFVIEEDHFRWPDYLARLKEPWESHPDMVESLDWFAFGSVDHIGKFAERYGWDAIAEMGIGVMFIGVESKFGDKLKYKKRSTVDPRLVFSKLHGMGIRTIGSWVCGWDFHDHANIQEDLNYFVSLCPTYQQLTRLSPFPGTDLYRRLLEEGRMRDVPWEDMHFWSGAQQNMALEEHETLNIVEHGYETMYQTWGPSLLRRLDVELNGYAYCRQSENPILRDHKSLFYKKQCGMLWTLLPAMERYAPNGIVQRRARQVDKKYRSLLGEPTPVMELASRAMMVLATVDRLKRVLGPEVRPPKQEPFKRYVFDKHENGNGNGHIPYRTEWPSRPSWSDRVSMGLENVRYSALEAAMKGTRTGWRKRSDPVVDDYLVRLVESQAFGFGL